MKSIDEIRTILKAELPKIKKEFNIEQIEIFGSFARKNQNSGSDIDILVTFNKKPGLIKYIYLENYLSNLLNIKVDLVMKNALKPNLRKNILSEAIPV